MSGRNWAQLGSRLPPRLKSSAKQLDATLLWARVGSQVRRGATPPPPSWAPPENAVLKTTAEWQAAVEELRRLRLPVHRDPTKNWDALAALATDFSRKPLDTGGMTAYGVPVHVFTPREITAALELARGLGLEPTGEVELDRPHDQTVVWRRFGLRYTCLVLTLRRAGG